jgi:hypothetical protein
MKNPESPATRLADALFLAGIVINGTLGAEMSPDTIIDLMQNAFDELIQRFGVRHVDRAAQILEAAFELICSEIFIEP